MRVPDPRLTRPRRGLLRDLGLLAPAVLTLGVLFGGALLGAVRESVVPLAAGGVGQANLDAWRALFSDPAFSDALRFTVQVTILSTALAALVAVGVAALLRPRGAALRTLASLPVPVPHLLVANLAVLWLAPGGLADRILGALPVQLVHDQLGLGIVLVYVYKESPFLVLLLLAVMGRGLAEREEATAVLGASAGQRLRWVLWPAIRAPLVIGSIIVAAFVFGSFEVPLTIGPNYPPTLSTFAYQATQNNLVSGEGEAAAALLLAAALSILLAVVAVRFARDVENA
ncbi:MAG: ABC transporter permease subunit [Solirubrobacteraceae bacterium]